MSKSKFQTPEFKALAAEWNQKLIEAGHNEIEDFTLPVPALKLWSYHSQGIDFRTYEARLAYFSNARALLHTYTFKNEVHKAIWAMYSEGEPIRDIAKKINKPGYRKSTVFSIIKVIAKEIK